MKLDVKKEMKRIFWLVLGSLIYAVSIALFLDPNHLAPGGVSGIAIIFGHFADIATGTLVILINLPLVALGLWKLNLKKMLYTGFVILLSSGMINAMEGLEPVTRDPMLAGVVGGTLLGLAIGIIFKNGATTGGVDIPITILRHRFPVLKTNQLFLMFDTAVIAASAFVFGDVEVALYAALATFISSVMLDRVLYGADEARLVYIISDRQEPISRRILEEAEAGVTYLKGRGAYTGEEKQVVFCAVPKRLLPQVQEIAREEDPMSFLIVTAATEIYGEGFKSHHSEVL